MELRRHEGMKMAAELDCKKIPLKFLSWMVEPSGRMKVENLYAGFKKHARFGAVESMELLSKLSSSRKGLNDAFPSPSYLGSEGNHTFFYIHIYFNEIGSSESSYMNPPSVPSHYCCIFVKVLEPSDDSSCECTWLGPPSISD